MVLTRLRSLRGLVRPVRLHLNAQSRLTMHMRPWTRNLSSSDGPPERTGQEREAGGHVADSSAPPLFSNPATTLPAYAGSASAGTIPAVKLGPFLTKYGSNLTKLAADGRLDPVVGREEEIVRAIQVLSRRTKNNPCLIGEPGVGKTAIAEGLARRIFLGDVPDSMKNKVRVTGSALSNQP